MLCVFLALVISTPIAVFGMSSTNYQINWDSINFGGLDVSTSTNYNLRDTIGEHGTGYSDSENYKLKAGYRSGETLEPYLSIDIGTQEDNIFTSWSSFSSSTRIVNVNSTSSFAIDDYIGVVENEGFAQLVAIGKITNISGNVITVDNWEGEPESISTSPSGTDDFVYRMNGNQATLGLQTIISESTSLTLTNIASNANNGYNVTIKGVDKLKSGSAIIKDVTDGTVSADSEEYGIEAVGSLAVGGGTDVDIPTSSQRSIQQSATYADNDRIGVIYKLSIGPLTPTGNFEQIVEYRVTGNF